MLIQLHGRHLRQVAQVSSEPFICRVTEQAALPADARERECLLARAATGELPRGFRAYLLNEDPGSTAPRDSYILSPKLSYLQQGDVIRIDPRRQFITVLYRRASPFNSLLVTERCDNYCVMCSQPPQPHDDDWIVDELRQVIPLMSPDTKEIGITGGEPALLGDALVDIVASLARHLPTTAVHVLSNGRQFSRLEFARQLARVQHPDLMIGVPLYSDLPGEHDYVVQARGAFSETIRGILNLARVGVSVELRSVIHRDTYLRLPDLARFISRNLLFVDHVALMGLEPVGFARANLDALWIDPLDYQDQLRQAVQILDRSGLRVSIYNHQLCVLESTLHPYARRSISDWKNTYTDACRGCEMKAACGGLFASSQVKMSRGIHRIQIE
jgi:His-Xaa-Ser system radical SAM maturase HxsC